MARENIDVTVELHDQLSRPAKRAERHVEQLVDATEELNRELRELQAEQAKAAAATAALGAAMGRTRAHKKAAKKEMKSYRSEADKGGKAMKALRSATSGFSNALERAAKKSKGLGGALKVLKLPALLSVVTMAATAVGALGAAAVAAAAGIGAIGQAAVGVMGALPALLAPLGQAFAVVKMGFSGIGEALKVLSDPAATAEELREALGKLGPEAREFTVLLAELKEQTSGWKDEIQAAMLPGFTDALRDMGGLLPVVQKGLQGSAGAIGNIARGAGNMISTWGPDLGEIMARNTRIIEKGFGPALTSALSILKDLMIAGGPLAERMATALGNFATKLAWITAEATQTGRLEGFFDRSATLLLRVWDVIKDVSVGLYNMGKEAQVMTGWMGTGIEDATAKFRAWTESVGGKSAIREYFAQALPIVKELVGFTGDILAMFSRFAVDPQLLPTIQGLRNDVLPAFEALSTGLTASLGPALTDLLTAFLEFSNVLSFNPLVTAVGIFADFAREVTKIVELSPGLSTFIATLLTAKTALSLFAFAAKASGIGSFFASVGKMITRLRIFSTAVVGNTAKLEANNTAQARSAKLGKIVRGGFSKIGKAAKGAAVLLRAMGAASYAALGPWGIAAIVIVGALTLLWFHSERFREIVIAIAKAVVEFGKDAWRVLKGVGVAIWQWLVKAWDVVASTVTSVAKTIWGVISTVFNAVWAVVDRVMHWIMNVVRTTANVYKQVFMVIRGIFILVFRHIIMPVAKVVFAAIMGYVRLLLAFWKTVFNAVRAVATAVFNAVLAVAKVVLNAIVGVARWFWGVIQSGFGIMRDVLAAVFGTIQTVASAIWEPIRAVAAGVWEGIQAGFGAMRDVLGGIWEGIKTAASAIWEPIKTAATTVIDALKTAFRGLGDVVGGIWDGIKSGFNAALEGIKDGINIAINAANSVIDGLNKVPGVDIAKIDNLFTGGATIPGQVAFTGELGPELFVPRVGPMSVLGAGGPELTNFSQSGYVVPNPTTPSSMTKPVPAWVTDRLEQSLPTVAAGQKTSRGEGAVATAEAPIPQLTLQFLGDGSPLTPADVEQAALRAYQRFERERRERR